MVKKHPSISRIFSSWRFITAFLYNPNNKERLCVRVFVPISRRWVGRSWWNFVCVIYAHWGWQKYFSDFFFHCRRPSLKATEGSQKASYFKKNCLNATLFHCFSSTLLRCPWRHGKWWRDSLPCSTSSSSSATTRGMPGENWRHILCPCKVVPVPEYEVYEGTALEGHLAWRPFSHLFLLTVVLPASDRVVFQAVQGLFLHSTSLTTSSQMAFVVHITKETIICIEIRFIVKHYLMTKQT